MSYHLAFLTFGVMHEPAGHPKVQGFIDRLPEVYAAADRSEGFLARSIRDMETWKHSWGEIVRPRCYAHIEDDKQLIMTLSLWKDLESVAAFAYHGPHAEALAKGSQWVAKEPGAPISVAWWVGEGHSVDWREAAERMDHLHEHGPTAYAFSLIHPFDANGNPYQLDRAAMRAKASRNVPA